MFKAEIEESPFPYEPPEALLKVQLCLFEEENFRSEIGATTSAKMCGRFEPLRLGGELFVTLEGAWRFLLRQ